VILIIYLYNYQESLLLRNKKRTCQRTLCNKYR